MMRTCHTHLVDVLTMVTMNDAHLSHLAFMHVLQQTAQKHVRWGHNVDREAGDVSPGRAGSVCSAEEDFDLSNDSVKVRRGVRGTPCMCCATRSLGAAWGRLDLNPLIAAARR